MLSEYLAIGEILKPQGVKGEMKIRPLTDDSSRFEGLEYVFLKEGDVYSKVKCAVSRVEDDRVYLFIERIKNRDAAEKMRGQLIYIDRAHAVKLDSDSEFICDLIGCTATDDRGNELGTLREVLQPGSADVYVFEGRYGTIMAPALKSSILNVDVLNKTMLFSFERLRETAVFDTDAGDIPW